MTSEPIGVRIDANDFELFELPLRFAQDRAVIDARWKALQLRVHPDRFASQGDAARRIAMEAVLRVNEAHRRLKNPLARAAYLCQLHGHTSGADARHATPTAVLMQQMAWREALEEAGTLRAVEALAADVDAQRQALHDRLGTLLDEQRDWAAAAGLVTTLMFIERLGQDIERRRDSLGA